MLDSKLLQTLATVIECKGFEKAASQLGITQSAVSQRIKQLEELLGQVLLIRSQPLEATAAGKSLLRHFRQLALLEQELMQQLKPDSPGQAHNILDIGTDSDSLACWLLPAVLPLIRQHGLQLRIHPGSLQTESATANPAHLCGWLSHCDDSVQGSHSRHLGEIDYLCVCTPDFHRTYFHQDITRALDSAPAVVLHEHLARHGRFLQQHWGYQGHFPYCSAPTPEAMLAMIHSGLAYGLLPQELLEQHDDAASLLTLGGILPLPLYWHHWGAEPILARQLGEALLAARQVRRYQATQTTRMLHARND
jgi:LysR family transcriptional regulator (chromosome initiation inhibitor)